MLLSIELAGGFVNIIVQDTGIGIGSEDLPHIFDRFFRVKGKATSHITGSGLGLALVKEVVEAHPGVYRCAVDARSWDHRHSAAFRWYRKAVLLSWRRCQTSRRMSPSEGKAKGSLVGKAIADGDEKLEIAIEEIVQLGVEVDFTPSLRS